MATTPDTLLDWNFKTKHVQGDSLIGTAGAQNSMISAESIILCAAPPAYDPATFSASSLIPLGLCDSITVAQTKNITQLYEIGSHIPFLIPGRTYIQMQLQTVVFNGMSLLAAINQGQTGEAAAADGTPDAPGATSFAVTDNAGAQSDTQGDFYLNLMSTFFDQPFGLAMIFQDKSGGWVAGFYAENCLTQTHQMGIQAQQYIVMENASIRCSSFKSIASP